MEAKDYIAVGAAVIALISVVATVVLNLRGQRRTYFAEMRNWADEACDVLSEAVHACELDPTDVGGVRHKLRIALSSLIDRGRWFFPNLQHADKGRDKARAFRGSRQPVLDLLVTAYKQVSTLSGEDSAVNTNIREPLVDVKREFASEIQRYLDPRRRREMFIKLTRFSGRTVARGSDRLAERTRSNRSS